VLAWSSDVGTIAGQQSVPNPNLDLYLLRGDDPLADNSDKRVIARSVRSGQTYEHIDVGFEIPGTYWIRVRRAPGSIWADTIYGIAWQVYTEETLVPESL
jgi:hypothetical protein